MLQIIKFEGRVDRTPLFPCDGIAWNQSPLCIRAILGVLMIDMLVILIPGNKALGSLPITNMAHDRTVRRCAIAQWSTVHNQKRLSSNPGSLR